MEGHDRRSSRRGGPPSGRLAILLAAALVLAPAVTPAWASAALTVVTGAGTYIAVPSPGGAGVDMFRGIRYAAPPVGELRWAPPQPPEASAGPILAASAGPACPQPDSTAPLAQSEDCLFLNVYVPASARPNSRLPVFFWIHGGALVSGAGSTYDPSTIVAQHNIIVVTINYRLGALGWLVEPGLAASAASFFQDPGDAGDYGLMDQQFALQWVRRNISGFGGDPDRVTIGGQSAGALSVSANLASPTTASGLFHGAIIESGAYMQHNLPSQATYQSIFGGAFAAALGCGPQGEAACLRAQPVANLLAAQVDVFGRNGVAPDFGTRVLPLSPKRAFPTGAFIRVPVLQGTNANEGRFFEPRFIPFAAAPAAVIAAGGPANFDLANPNTFCADPQSTGAPTICAYPQEIDLFLAALRFSAVDTPALDALLAQAYPLASFPDPYLAHGAPSADEALSQIFTDLVFACNASDSDIDLSRFTPLYAYEFDDPAAPPGGAAAVIPPNDVFGFPTASEHGAEVQFLFDSGARLNAGEQQLASEMKSYWANFVKTGDPNLGQPVPPWILFNVSHAVQVLTPGPAYPRPFFSFRAEHMCRIMQPILAREPQR